MMKDIVLDFIQVVMIIQEFMHQLMLTLMTYIVFKKELKMLQDMNHI